MKRSKLLVTLALLVILLSGCVEVIQGDDSDDCQQGCADVDLRFDSFTVWPREECWCRHEGQKVRLW